MTNVGSIYNSTNELAKKKNIISTPGTQKGSLAFFVGEALGVKHQGKSTGLVRAEIVDKQETREYHANKDANRNMAKSMAELVMNGAANGTKVAKYIQN